MDLKEWVKDGIDLELLRKLLVIRVTDRCCQPASHCFLDDVGLILYSCINFLVLFMRTVDAQLKMDMKTGVDCLSTSS